MHYQEKMNLSLKTIFGMVIIPELIFGVLCLYFYFAPDWFPDGLDKIGFLSIYFISLGVRLVYYIIMFGIFGAKERIPVGR